jgi:hypothetical protein
MNMLAFTRFAVIFNGVLTILTALLLLFAPEFFYNTVADYPPFNRHFLGDIGAFSLAVGVGLLLAAREPYKHPLIIGVATLGNLLHVLNHAYDDLFVERLTTQHWLTNTIPLLVATVMLMIAYWNVSKANKGNTK